MTGPKTVSDKQLAANRRNALKSTGPRTDEGRAVVRYNALKHGILAQAVIPEALEPYESRQAFEDLLSTLRGEFGPANTIEEMLVEQIATTYWRLARLYRAESGAIARAQDVASHARNRPSIVDLLSPHSRAVAPDPLRQRLQQLEACRNNKSRLRKAYADMDPSVAEVPDDELRERAEREIASLAEQIAERERREAAHDQAVDSAVHSLPKMDEALKFARYEAALQRQLDRALSRLERLQRQRGGDHVPPPLQIDVDVSGGE